MHIASFRKLLAGLVVILLASCVYANDVVKISKDQLKEQLSKPDVAIVDVRTGHDWEASQWKIQGAVREDPAKVEAWMPKYPKDKTIVLYCA